MNKWRHNLEKFVKMESMLRKKKISLMEKIYSLFLSFSSFFFPFFIYNFSKFKTKYRCLIIYLSLLICFPFSKKGKTCFSILLKVFFFFRDLLKFYTLSWVIQVQINISSKHRIPVRLQVDIQVIIRFLNDSKIIIDCSKNSFIVLLTKDI